MGIVKVLAGFIGSAAIGKYGRKTLFLFGSSVQAVSFLVLYFMMELDSEDLLFIPVTTYVFGFSLGLGAVCNIYTFDILPSNGVSIVLAVQQALNSAIGKLTPILAKK